MSRVLLQLRPGEPLLGRAGCFCSCGPESRRLQLRAWVCFVWPWRSDELNLLDAVSLELMVVSIYITSVCFVWPWRSEELNLLDAVSMELMALTIYSTNVCFCLPWRSEELNLLDAVSMELMALTIYITSICLVWSWSSASCSRSLRA